MSRKTPARLRPPTRQRRAADTQRRIAVAARRLFEARGFDAVTTDEIASAAGVAKGTVFLHAPTKERLLVLAFESELRRVSARAFAHVQDDLPVPAALGVVFRRLFRLYEGSPDLARRFVQEAQFLGPADAPGLEQVRLAFLARLVALLAARQRRGEIAADVNLPLAALDSFLLYFGVLTGWLSGLVRLPATRDRLLDDSLALLWRGLRGG